MFSAPFIRRYRCPLAILKITGSQSSLSTWLNKPVVNKVNYELSLTQREPALTISGNQGELEQLIDAVATEIEDLVLIPQDNPTAIGQLMLHKLNFAGQTLTLETIELADLGEVLDQYQDDIMALDELDSPRLVSFNWLYGAAGIVLALGTTFAIGNYYRNAQNVASDEGAISLVEPQGQPPLEQAQTEVIPPELPADIQTLDGAAPTPNADGTVPPPPITPASPQPIPAPPENVSPPPPVAPEQIETSIAIQPPTPTAQPKIVIPPSPPTPDIPAAPVTPIAELESQFSEEQNSLARANRDDGTGLEQKNSALVHTLQLSQAENYFADRWQVPENLNQSLQYRLDISPNGTVNKITPIGKTSAAFIDQVPLPQAGESLVSPLPEAMAMRAVFNQDGTIQTFYE